MAAASDRLAQAVEAAIFGHMSIHTIHIRSENPDLLIEFDLPPGTHAVIGASPKSEVTLPLGGIPPFSCIIGRFHDGRLYLADLDHAISQRLDLPTTLLIPPYQFDVFHPEDEVEEIAEAAPPEVADVPPRVSGLSEKLKTVLARFTKPGSPRPPADAPPPQDPA